MQLEGILTKSLYDQGRDLQRGVWWSDKRGILIDLNDVPLFHKFLQASLMVSSRFLRFSWSLSLWISSVSFRSCGFIVFFEFLIPVKTHGMQGSPAIKELWWPRALHPIWLERLGGVRASQISQAIDTRCLPSQRSTEISQEADQTEVQQTLSISEVPLSRCPSDRDERWKSLWCELEPDGRLLSCPSFFRAKDRLCVILGRVPPQNCLFISVSWEIVRYWGKSARWRFHGVG